MKKSLWVFFLLIFILPNGTLRSQNKQHIIANPLNLNYRFMPKDDYPARREAADPVLEYFKGKYYLFASKSGGYWSSPDLFEWTYIQCKSITTIEDYAPAILIYNDELYYLGSGGKPQIFKTKNPDQDNWEPVDTKFNIGMTDPALFRDDNGEVYLYWGCSDVNPIMGVKVDPNDGFKMIGEPKVLITHNEDKYGWEIPGENNEMNKAGWNEGPCMIKYKGKYYLQYAAPGTQFRTYGDGVYISDNPLGPYSYAPNTPFCFKPGGFIGGAGHGHTFQDKYGNYWHVATMKISVRHMFERRIGLFPVYLSDDNNMYSHTVFTDYPFYIPDKKVDFEKNDCSLKWNILSYKKKVSASSSLPEYKPGNANDEKVESWWAAQSGKPGEWWQVDLGKAMTVNALQINFADHNFALIAPEFYCYQYIVEHSTDGNNWKTLIDRTSNTKDMPHELIVLDKSVQTRYLRIKNTKEIPGNFSLSDFRVFGNANGKLPQKVSGLVVERDKTDKRIFRLNWEKGNNTTGYIVRWGVDKKHLNNAKMIYENAFDGRFFNRDSEYYFSVDSFNENGVTGNK